MPKWSGNTSTSDRNSHDDCNRTGTVETVNAATGEVTSDRCGGCGGNGTTSNTQRGNHSNYR
jgi:hypothetical protein